MLNGERVVLSPLRDMQTTHRRGRRHLCEVSDLGSIRPTMDEVVGNGGGSLFLSSLVHVPQDFRRSAMEAGAPAADKPS